MCIPQVTNWALDASMGEVGTSVLFIIYKKLSLLKSLSLSLSLSHTHTHTQTHTHRVTSITINTILISNSALVSQSL